MDVWLRSIFVSLGSSSIAVFLAAILAIATFGRRSLIFRCQSALVGSIMLLPSYVVAGAWSAGFGTLGWWSLSQVVAAKFSWIGIASVVWIHAMAATPIAYGLLMIGLRLCPRPAIDLASMEGNFWHQINRGILPNWFSWLLGTFFLIAAWVSSDMVVTNLFQVTTLTERCYLNMISDNALWSNTLDTCGLGVSLAIAGFLVLRMELRRLRPERQPGSWNRSAIGSDWIFAMAGGAVALLLVGIPLTNLIAKAGMRATISETEIITRIWSFRSVIQNIAMVPIEYAEELQWSLSLACWSATIALLSVIPGILFSIRRFTQPLPLVFSGYRHRVGILVVILLVTFALPGPIVNQLVIAFFQFPIVGLAWLNDHTLLAPILCLQFRLLPLTVFAFLVVDRQWRYRVGDLGRIDADKPWLSRFYVYWMSMAKSLVLLWILLFAVAFGDLSTYILCLPPGVTPISMRIFDLLHYGVRSSESGLLVGLAIAGAIVGYFLFRFLDRDRSLTFLDGKF